MHTQNTHWRKNCNNKTFYQNTDVVSMTILPKTINVDILRFFFWQIVAQFVKLCKELLSAKNDEPNHSHKVSRLFEPTPTISSFKHQITTKMSVLPDKLCKQITMRACYRLFCHVFSNYQSYTEHWISSRVHTSIFSQFERIFSRETFPKISSCTTTQLSGWCWRTLALT